MTMENTEFQNTIVEENEIPISHLDIKQLINDLPDHIADELKTSLIDSKKPLIPVYEKDEDFFNNLDSKDNKEDKDKLTTGIILLNELCTSSLAYSIINNNDNSAPLDQYPDYFEFLTDTLGLDDTFVGLMEHLEIAMLSGNFIDVNNYIESNYPYYGNLYNLAFGIGESYKILNSMKNSNVNRNIFKKITPKFLKEGIIVGSYFPKEEKIFLNKDMYTKNFIKQTLNYISTSTFAENLNNIMNSHEENPDTKLLISNLLLTLSSFSVLDLSKAIKNKNQMKNDFLTHEAIHYLSQTKENGKTTRFGFYLLDYNRLKERY